MEEEEPSTSTKHYLATSEASSVLLLKSEFYRKKKQLREKNAESSQKPTHRNVSNFTFLSIYFDDPLFHELLFYDCSALLLHPDMSIADKAHRNF